jgi:hypothetical protein
MPATQDVLDRPGRSLAAAQLGHIVLARLGAHQPLEQGGRGLWCRAVGAHSLEALEREVRGDLGMLGDQPLVTASVDDQ